MIEARGLVKRYGAMLVLALAVAVALTVAGCASAATSTPASSTPASSTPASSTPASSTPASSTPASSTPASSTPASSTPASSSTASAHTTPAGGTTHIIYYSVNSDGPTSEAILTGRTGEIFDHLPLADGRTVAVIADDDPDERDDVIVWGEGAPGHRLRLLDLDSGALVTAAGLGDRHVVEVAQRPDGGPLAVISWACPQDEPGAFTARLHVVDPGTGKACDLGPAGLDVRSPAWWSAGGQWHLAYLAVTPPGPVGGVAVFDVLVPDGDGAGEHRNLTAGMTVCPAEIVQVAAALRWRCSPTGSTPRSTGSTPATSGSARCPSAQAGSISSPRAVRVRRSPRG